MDSLRQQDPEVFLGARGGPSRNPSSLSAEHVIPQHQNSSSKHGGADVPGGMEPAKLHANITIAILDPRLPVLLWTSLNDWKSPYPMMDLGMDESHRLNFTCEIDKVPEGCFEYKVQMGDGTWVLDETKEMCK